MARRLRLLLPDPLGCALAARAARELRPEAEILRRALADYLASPEPPSMPDPSQPASPPDAADWRAMGGLRAAFTQVLAEHGAPTAELQSGSARLLALLLELGPTAEPQLGARLEAVRLDLLFAASFLRASAGTEREVQDLAREVEEVAGRVGRVAAKEQ